MTKYPRQEGYDSRFTQKVANNFPGWHVIRTDETTTGFKMLNSHAMTIGEIETDIQINRRNLYLSTAETQVRWEAYRMTVPQGMEFGLNSSLNLLLNANFQQHGMAVKNQPLDWVVESGVRMTTRSYKGTSVLFNPAPSESAYMYQDIDGDFHAGDVLTASIYVNDTGNYSASEFGVPYLALTISAFDYDGTTPSTSVVRSLNDVSGWERNTATLNLGVDAFKVRYRVDVIYPDPSGSTSSEISDHISFFSWGGLGEPPSLLDALGAASYGIFTDGATLPNTTTWVSAAQLEPGAYASEWRPSQVDLNLHTLRVIADYGQGEDPAQIELREVVAPFDLFEDAIPSRATTSLGITGDVIAYDSGPVYYEWSNEFWTTGFRITGDVVQLFNTEVNNETLISWDIYDRYIDNLTDEDEEYGIVEDVTRTLEALTIFNKRLYVIAKEVHDLDTKRILKVLDWAGIDDRLQVIKDIDIGFSSGDVVSIGFIEGYMDRLGLTFNDDTEATVQFAYDLYFNDTTRRQLIMRQQYSDATLILIEV